MSLATAKANAVAAWLFNESAEPFNDEIGSNDLSISGTVTAGATGKFGNAISIAQNGYVYCSDHDALSLPNDQDWSIVTWFATTHPAIDIQTIAAKGSPREWLLWRFSGVFGDDQINFQWKNDSGGTLSIDSAVNAVAGTGWHCVVIRHRASDHLVDMVIDGTVEADTETFSGTALNSTGQFQVGADWDQGAKWLGTIDETIIIKGYRLSDSDCTDLWNSGTGVSFDDWDAGGGGTFQAAWACYSNVIFCEV